MIAFTVLFILVASLVGLWFSSSRAVANITHLAFRWNLSTLFVGFFILSFASALPELAIALQAIATDTPLLSASNVLGANISILTLCIGSIVIITGPLCLKKTELKQQIIIIGLCAFSLILLLLFGELNETLGAFLIIFYGLTMSVFYFIKNKKEETLQILLHDFKQEETSIKAWNANDFGRLIFALMLVFVFSKIAVESALQAAQHFNLALPFIGAVIMGIGSTLPELSLNVQAARQKNYALAYGNLFGAVFTQGALVMGVLGFGSAQSISLESIFYMAPFMLITYLFLGLRLFFNNKINRLDGILLLAIYGIFIARSFMISAI